MLTQARLKELFHYCPESGLLTRLLTVSSRARCGDIAGCPHGNGYLRITIDYKNYFAHRIIWIYTHGEDPDEIDHINGVRDDNRIANLRSIPGGENRKNMKTPKNNTSGVMGVSWDKNTSKWRSIIYVGGGLTNIESFLYKFDAICARKSAELRHGYHENHGRIC